MARAPGARVDHAMTFDSGRGVVVLFGGTDPAVPFRPFGDTWIYLGP